MSGRQGIDQLQAVGQIQLSLERSKLWSVWNFKVEAQIKVNLQLCALVPGWVTATVRVLLLVVLLTLQGV